ncbi:hypothetical protein AB1Y20_011214 [Prymnesium parvum]|uniref:Secreted protein n=1 Tax=Prymnesium parvum TaxID=97485 RepID=A0AB34IPT4_PRYPA
MSMIGAGCAPTAAVWLAPTLRSLNRSGTMTVSHSARPEQSSRNGSMPTGLAVTEAARHGCSSSNICCALCAQAQLSSDRRSNLFGHGLPP